MIMKRYGVVVAVSDLSAPHLHLSCSKHGRDHSGEDRDTEHKEINELGLEHPWMRDWQTDKQIEGA